MTHYQLWTLIAFIALTTFGCTKEKETVIEKQMVPERTVSKRSDSFLKAEASNQIEISKSNLGKAFIIIPSMTTSDQNPQVNYLKPLIVSFEKSGDKIALFNLTEEQLYDTVPSDRLLQTFKVISEDEKSLKINLAKGFTSFDGEEVLGALTKDTYTQLLKHIKSGEVSSVEVKDSFVRSAKISKESLIIEQVMRIKTDSLVEKTEPNKVGAKPKPQMVSTENTNTFVFEIKPYFKNENFKAKTYDKEQRIGYFLNFALQKQIDEPIPQITRWDISESKGPIVVRLHAETPKAAIQTLEEGILYWNRAFGNQVLEIGAPFKSGERQTDRTILVYWIPWDSAGFARANFQADPITGEIFRGQVFMTSSWYKGTQKAARIVLTGNMNQTSNYSQCNLDQSQLMGSSMDLNTTDENIERISLDTVRVVLAHEMGHALGLRHNFAGSSTTSFLDADLPKNRANYIAANGQPIHANSTTVMDYTSNAETAENGSVILNQVLPYDQAAIDWGYLNRPMTIEKYNYCSDEHIMLAQENQKNIYGCDRFDKNKNIFLGKMESLLQSEKNKMTFVFSGIIAKLASNSSYFTNSEKFESILTSIDFQNITGVTEMDDFIYKDATTAFYSIPAVVDSLFNSLIYTSAPYDPLITDVLKKDLSQVGGLSAVITNLNQLQVSSGGKLYESQVVSFFQKLDPSYYQDQISAAQLEQIKTAAIAKAQEADSKFLINILKYLPLHKYTYSKDPATDTYKAADSTVAANFGLGNIQDLISLYGLVYEQLIHNVSKKTTINGVEKEYKFVIQKLDPNLDLVKNFYLSTAMPATELYKNSEPMRLGKEKMKALAVANTLDVLQTLQIPAVAPITSDGLTLVINQIDWTKIMGLTKQDLDNEIAELKSWEAIK